MNEWSIIMIKRLITLGITALFFLRVLIEKEVCDLDVGLKFITGVEVSKLSLFDF